MKQINKIEVVHVISKPGDYTKYDYLIIKQSDTFKIVGYGSIFAFPDILEYCNIVEIETLEHCIEHIKANSDLANISPHTLLEVVTTIKELYNT